jgi:dephospho-CoA kinase
VEPLAAPLRIGLTGGIGSGKSTVAAMFALRGAAVIDADAISRQLTASGGTAMPALIGVFGARIARADGALDRDAMRALAFTDSQARARLEGVMHPLIAHEAQREAAASTARLMVFDVPLLAESAHWRARVDRVLVVDCSVETQITRVVERAGWSRESAERAIAAQASRKVRRAVADAVIDNDGKDLPALQRDVAALWQAWTHPVEQ